ncbi:helix-turn-helix domain-containing protein [Entomomonas sp. E2T0]|uniref:helix-turn-helix transcriptional regulator n=1 Tax=Entomomonas sp. E2T0 TaxID=2930213 RepID=UPI0022283101|nr:helix-turn-helix transcriptional regulator [Entomomonas sp. E2T0]UYZ85021.1 helix-turn-helix domain-containing protein [Entomomonas sp. E2T0]
MVNILDVGQQIRRIRKLKLLSQESLSEKIGIDPKSLGRIEKGDYYPAMDTLYRLSVALKVPIQDLFPDIGGNKEISVTEDIRHFLVDFIYSASEQQLVKLYKAALKLKD